MAAGLWPPAYGRRPTAAIFDFFYLKVLALVLVGPKSSTKFRKDRPNALKVVAISKIQDYHWGDKGKTVKIKKMEIDPQNSAKKYTDTTHGGIRGVCKILRRFIGWLDHVTLVMRREFLAC
jgi:hypothetical protein